MYENSITSFMMKLDEGKIHADRSDNSDAQGKCYIPPDKVQKNAKEDRCVIEDEFDEDSIDNDLDDADLDDLLEDLDDELLDEDDLYDDDELSEEDLFD